MAETATPTTRVVRFIIHYGTVPSQNVLLVGSSSQLGRWDKEKAVKMGYSHDGGLWSVEVEVESRLDEVQYKYVVVDESNGATFWEGGDNRVISLKYYNGPIECRDTWRAGNMPETTYLSTTLFEDVVFARPSVTISKFEATKGGDLTVKFRLQTIVNPKHTIAVTGSIPSLGSWSPSKGVPLNPSTASKWGVDVTLNASEAPFEYKYVILDETKSVVAWEEGANRRFHPLQRTSFSATGAPTSPAQTTAVVAQDIFRKPFYWRGAGIAVPVFALRSQDGLGVGEFLDIKKLADFSEKIGSKIIQILPVNDTSCFLTWRDSYPYSSLSVFALHPQYLRVQELTDDPKLLEQISAEAKKLNALSKIDYEAVMAAKNKFVSAIWEKKKATFLASSNWKAWKESNQHWLVPYVVFCYLRDQYKTTDFNTWKQEHRHMTRAAIDKFAAEHAENVGINFFIQYHLHVQLSDASDYARSKGVGLKGDLPIGVNRQGYE